MLLDCNDVQASAFSEVYREALAWLDEGRRWTQGAIYFPLLDQVCLLGAMGEAVTGVPRDGYHLSEACLSPLGGVIGEHYADRLPMSGLLPSEMIMAFNDHKSTTFDDVRTVLEKAALKLEEQA